MCVTMWGFESSKYFSKYYQLLQQQQLPGTGPTLRQLEARNGIPLEALDGSIDIPHELLDLHNLPQCVEDPHQLPNEHFLDPAYSSTDPACRLVLRTIGESRLYCLPVTNTARDGAPSNRVRNPTNETWPSILQTTRGLTATFQGEMGQPTSRRFEACRIDDQIYLSAAHRDFPMCSALRSEVAAQYNGNERLNRLDYNTAHRLASHFPRGHFCFDPTTPGAHEYNLRVNANVASGAYVAFRGSEGTDSALEWIQRNNGFSALGVSYNFTWLTHRFYMHHAPIPFIDRDWVFVDNDPQAYNIYRGLLEVFDDQINASRNQKEVPFQAVITIAVPLLFSLLNSEFRASLRNAWHNILSILGRETRLTWDNFIRRLSAPPAQLNNLAQVYRAGADAAERSYRSTHSTVIESDLQRARELGGVNALKEYGKRHKSAPIRFLEPLDDIDRNYQKKIATYLQRPENGSVWVYGPPGDGKTISALKFVYDAIHGNYGAELASRTYLMLTKNFFGAQSGEYRSALAGQEGIMRLRNDFLAALDDLISQGRKVTLVIDEFYWFLHTNEQGSNAADEFVTELRTRMADNSDITLLTTFLEEHLPILAKKYPDLFGSSGRGTRHPRPVRTPKQIIAVIRRRRLDYERTHFISIPDNSDIWEAFAETAYRQDGYYNPRTAINIMDGIINRITSRRPEATIARLGQWQRMRSAVMHGLSPRQAPQPNNDTQETDSARMIPIISTEMIEEEGRRMSQETFDSQLRLAFTNSPEVAREKTMTLPNEIEQVIIFRIIAESYPTFDQWGQTTNAEAIHSIAHAWHSPDSRGIRATYTREYGSSSAFIQFCRDALNHQSVLTSLEKNANLFRESQRLPTSPTPLAASSPTSTPTAAEAPTSPPAQTPLTVDAIVPILETRYPSIFGDPSCTMDTKRGFARIIEPTLRRQGITEISAGVIPEAQFRRAIDATLSHIEFMREQTEYAHLETMREHVERSEEALRRGGH